jgi:hypothetical protein
MPNGKEHPLIVIIFSGMCENDQLGKTRLFYYEWLDTKSNIWVSVFLTRDSYNWKVDNQINNTNQG